MRTVETPKGWQFSKTWHGVWRARIGAHAKLVYSAIDWFGKEAFPKQETIAEMTELSVDSVQRAIKVLEAEGFLVVKRRQRKSSVYILYPDRNGIASR